MKIEVNGDITEYLVEDLDPASHYMFLLSAINNAGTSDISNVLSALTYDAGKMSILHKVNELRPDFFIYSFNGSSLSNFSKSLIKMIVKTSILLLFFAPYLIQSHLSK